MKKEDSRFFTCNLQLATCILILFFVFIPDTIFGESPEDLVEAGNSLYARGKYDEAIEKYLEAQKYLPPSPIIQFNIGAVMYKTGGYSKAGDYFANALSAGDSGIKWRVYYNLGNIRFRVNDVEGAIKSFKEALKINHRDMDAKYNLEIALRSLPSVKEREKIAVTSGETPARSGDKSVKEVRRLSETELEEGASAAVSKGDEAVTQGGGADTRRGGSYTIEEIDKERAEKILDNLRKEELRTLRDMRRAMVPKMSGMEKNW